MRTVALKRSGKEKNGNPRHDRTSSQPPLQYRPSSGRTEYLGEGLYLDTETGRAWIGPGPKF